LKHILASILGKYLIMHIALSRDPSGWIQAVLDRFKVISLTKKIKKNGEFMRFRREIILGSVLKPS
jgi:hypothetical protein